MSLLNKFINDGATQDFVSPFYNWAEIYNVIDKPSQFSICLTFSAIFLILTLLGICWPEQIKRVTRRFFMAVIKSPQFKLLKGKPFFKAFIFFAIIGFIGFKTYYVYQSADLINPEVLGPNILSLSGKALEVRYLHKKLTPLDECKPKSSCRDDTEKQNSAVIIKTSKDFIAALNDPAEKEAAKKYLIENHFPYFGGAAFRGRLMHHYSTILFPYREYQSGNYSYLLTAQNGLAGLLPLFFMRDSKFSLFPVIGMVFWGLFALLVLLAHYKGRQFYFFAAPLWISAVTLYTPAQIMHPGFSYFRYVPSLALIYLTHQFLRGRFKLALVCFPIFCLLNSLQFNILICIIIIALMISRSVFKGSKIPYLYCLLLLISGIVLLQIYYFEQQKTPATPSLFGSLGEGAPLSLIFCFQLLILPFSAFALKFWNERLELRFSASELLGYISFVCFSSYAASKIGSPQHYSGFIFMAVYSVYLILKDTEYSSLVYWGLLGIFVVFPSMSFNFSNTGGPPGISNSTLYHPQTFGMPLTFTSYHDLNLIQKEYETLISGYRSKGKIYFLSKDKIYLETLSGKNIDPKFYDPFVSSSHIDTPEFTKQITKIGIKYLVIDSPLQRKVTEAFIRFKALEMEGEESKLYLLILSAHDHFATEHASQLTACSKRYCLYKL